MKRIKNNPAKYIQRSAIAGAAGVALKDQQLTTQTCAPFNFMDATPDDRFYFDFAPHLSPPPSQKK